MEALDTVETLLLERYNLRAPDDSSVFAAIALVREEATEASIALLRGEMHGRELYRWTEAVEAAMSQVEPTTEKQEATSGSNERQKPVGRRKPALQEGVD